MSNALSDRHRREVKVDTMGITGLCLRDLCIRQQQHNFQQ